MPINDRRRHRAAAARLEGRRRAAVIARRAGTGLLQSRTATRLTQEQASARAGISQASWSRIERGASPAVSLETLASCAAAVGVQLAAFIEARPGADLPRDIEHLRRQELVIGISRDGGWQGRPEIQIDPLAFRSRSIDVHLERSPRSEIAVVEIEDLLADGGAVFRGLADKVAAVRATASRGVRVQGLLVLRSTARNRTTLAELGEVFGTRFPGSSRDWLRALSDPHTPMPDGDGIVWSSVRGDRLFAMGTARSSARTRPGR